LLQSKSGNNAAVELRVIEEQKLRAEVSYLYENSMFYRKKFDAVDLKPEHIKTVQDLKLIPFTTKDELRESQVEYPPLGDYLAVPREKTIRIHSSSGTTGEIRILLDEPGPSAKPPLKVVVEAASLENAGNLQKELEDAIRSKLIVPAKVTLVPPGVMPRSEMKTQLLIKLYEEKPEWLK